MNAHICHQAVLFGTCLNAVTLCCWEYDWLQVWPKVIVVYHWLSYPQTDCLKTRISLSPYSHIDCFISPLLRQVHWLSVRQRVMFKVLGLMHQSLAGAAPSYLADNCQLLSDLSRRTLRSSATDFRTLVIPQTHNKFSDRSVSAASPRQWNDLPPELWWLDLSFPMFRQKLSAH